MGFMDFLKSTFSKGGIKVKLDAPAAFTWGDETIPVTVTLTGHKTEPRTIASLHFTVEDELDTSDSDGDSSTTYGSRVQLSWDREGAITLSPGQSITLEIPVQIAPAAADHSEMQATRQASMQDTTAGRFLGAASKLGVSFGVLTDPGDIRDYLVTVHAPVQGANNVAKSSRKIRQGGAFQMKTGWSL